MPFVVTYEWPMDDFDDERTVDVEAVAFTREEAERFVHERQLEVSSVNADAVYGYEIHDVPLAFS